MFSLSASLYSQSSYIGSELSYSFGVPNTINRASGIINRYGVETPGISSEHQYGFGLRYLGRDIFRTNFGLSAGIHLSLAEGLFRSDPFPYNDTRYSYSIATSLGLLGAELSPQFSLGNFSAGAGLWTSYRLNEGMYQTETRLNPDSSALVSAGSDIGSAALRYGPLASLSWIAEISEGVVLMPTLRVSLDTESLLTDKMGIASLRAGGGISLLLSTGQGESVAPLQPAASVPAAIPQSPPPLSFGIRLHADGDSAVTLYSYRRRFRNVYFMPEKLSVPEFRAQALLDREAAAAFSEEKLIRLSPGEISRQALNIMAKRLRDLPGAGITISAPPSEATELRDYLFNIWGIAARQVLIQTQRNTSLRHLSFPGPSVPAPLELEWVEEGFELAPLSLRHSLRDTGSVRAWQLVISDGEKKLFTQSGKNISELENLMPHLRFGGNSAPDRLITGLSVSDSLGRRFSATDTLELRKENIKQSVLSLYFNGSGLSGKQSLLRELLGGIGAGAEIEFTFAPEGKGDAVVIMQMLKPDFSSLNSRPAAIEGYSYSLVARTRE